jgi:hypothetical protein
MTASETSSVPGVMNVNVLMNYSEKGKSTHQFLNSFVKNRHIPRHELLALISDTRVQHEVNETRERRQISYLH